MKLVRDKKPEERAISAESKLLWAQFIGPFLQAAAAMNAAITNAQNVMAGVIAEKEGLEPGEWAFDMDRQVMVKRPKG